MSSRSLPKPPLEHIADSNPRELAERLRLALDLFHAGEWTWDADTDVISLSPVACEILGLATGTAITWTAMQRDLLHPQDAPSAAKAVRDAIAAGGPYRTEYRSRRPSDGEAVWILASGQVRRDASGQVSGMIGIVQDITARKHQQIALSEEAQALDTLNRTGALVASELDLEKCVQAVTDAGVEIVGAQFGAFFYNVIAPSGEQYMLYTLSGAPREAFSRFPMPRNTPVFAPTFTGAGIVRSDDIAMARWSRIGACRWATCRCAAISRCQSYRARAR